MQSIRLTRSLFFLIAVMAMILTVTHSELSSAQGAPPPPSKQKQAEIDAQKKAQEAMKKAAHDALKAQESELLQSAYVLLASANNNYAGHKGKAMHEIEEALKVLDKDLPKRVQLKVKSLQDLHKVVAAKLLTDSSVDGHELQAISDSQVANAGLMLTQLVPVLVAHKQPVLHQHVTNAIKEIQAAPKHDSADASIKGKEVQILTHAYILMASANHDYDGHRVKAMKSLEIACHSLEADVLKSGTVAEKIKAMNDANAKSIADGKASDEPEYNRPQALSDAQLYVASSMIQRAGISLSNHKQTGVLKHIKDAQTEIGIALKIR